MVWAEAQAVGLYVWPVVWAAKRPDVRTLGVRAGRRFEPSATYLALVVVKFLDSRGDRCVSDDAEHCRRLSLCWSEGGNGFGARKPRLVNVAD